jgi:hypothetical protein
VIVRASAQPLRTLPVQQDICITGTIQWGDRPIRAGRLHDHAAGPAVNVTAGMTRSLPTYCSENPVQRTLCSWHFIWGRGLRRRGASSARIRVSGLHQVGAMRQAFSAGRARLLRCRSAV